MGLMDGTLAGMIMNGRQATPFRDGGDTRTFQQYDSNNSIAQRQLQPAWDEIRGQVGGLIDIPMTPLMATMGDEASISDLRSRVIPDKDKPYMSAIQAFHGTPHTFPAEPNAPFGKLSNEAIGSGEGAQAYGWGHYSAESPKVAEQYGKVLSKDLIEGRKPDLNNPRDLAAIALSNVDSPQKAVENLLLNKQFKLKEQHPLYDEAARIIQAGEQLPPVGSTGNVYSMSHQWPDAAKETANPLSKEHLLQWDKPIDEQSPHVQNALESAGLWDEEFRGGDLYQQLVRQKAVQDGHRIPDQGASEYLNSLGIPGMTYADELSRYGNGNTNNIVMFDPAYTKINGLLSE